MWALSFCLSQGRRTVLLLRTPCQDGPSFFLFSNFPPPSPHLLSVFEFTCCVLLFDVFKSLRHVLSPLTAKRALLFLFLLVLFEIHVSVSPCVSVMHAPLNPLTHSLPLSLLSMFSVLTLLLYISSASLSLFRSFLSIMFGLEPWLAAVCV
eukprot:m.130554 g.130554  ORF g.130554 m.130554 type:complete len:151 (-) comp14778_c1_seq2:240-692(-)